MLNPEQGGPSPEEMGLDKWGAPLKPERKLQVDKEHLTEILHRGSYKGGRGTSHFYQNENGQKARLARSELRAAEKLVVPEGRTAEQHEQTLVKDFKERIKNSTSLDELLQTIESVLPELKHLVHNSQYKVLKEGVEREDDAKKYTG